MLSPSGRVHVEPDEDNPASARQGRKVHGLESAVVALRDPGGVVGGNGPLETLDDAETEPGRAFEAPVFGLCPAVPRELTNAVVSDPPARVASVKRISPREEPMRVVYGEETKVVSRACSPVRERGGVALG